MPSYVLLAHWTDQGVRTISDLEEMGGHFRQILMTMGEYDIVATYEAPDDAVAARFSLMLGKSGNVRITSLKAFPEEAFRQIVQSLP